MFNAKRALTTLGAVAPIAAALVLTPAPASAQTRTTTFQVTASVAANCTISATTLAFGAYDPVDANATAPLDGQGGVTIACTRGSTASIGMDNGSYYSSGRRMSDGQATPSFLTYELFQDASRATPWGNASGSWFTPAVAPSKAPRTFPVYGRVAAGQDAPAGSYSDTVTATVNF
jgi:spore coat protein U-like protein